MSTRVNLCSNPSLKNDATGWFGPTTPTAWARITTSTGLPRTTAFAGTSAGNLSPARGNCTPGLTYRLSGYVKNTSAITQNFIVNVGWFTAGAFTSSSTNVPVTLAAGAITRVDTGAVVAPPGVDQMLLNFTSLDGAGEITGLLYEQTSALLPFFDGDSTNAVWNGTNGNSTSTLTVVDKTGSDTFTLGESSRRDIDGVSGDSVGFMESSFLVTLAYDDLRGRVRISAFGFDDSVIRAVVYAKVENEPRFSPIRGGSIDLVDGDFPRPVDHYEFAAGISTQYKIVGLSSTADEDDVIVQESVLTRQDNLEEVWLKFIAMPFLNRKITLTGWGDVSRQSRNGEFNVIGRVDPVVVTDVHNSRRTTITVLTRDAQETEELDLALSQGAPVYLHVPTHCALRTMYAVVGDISYRRIAPRSHRSLFEIALTEVSAPPLSLVGATMTCQLLLNTYATCQEVLDNYDTCQEVVN